MTTNRGGVDPGDMTPHGRMTPSAPSPHDSNLATITISPDGIEVMPVVWDPETNVWHRFDESPETRMSVTQRHERAVEFLRSVAAREREEGLAYVRECGDALRSELGLPSAQVQDALELRDQLRRMVGYYTTQFRLLANALKPIAAMLNRDTEKMLAALETLGEPA